MIEDWIIVSVGEIRRIKKGISMISSSGFGQSGRINTEHTVRAI